jgi:hypothetical protein
MRLVNVFQIICPSWKEEKTEHVFYQLHSAGEQTIVDWYGSGNLYQHSSDHEILSYIASLPLILQESPRLFSLQDRP